ncbi:MAG TPA: deoxyribonuclease IV [Dehalococcoidia bacterium]|nr:deoxyribonuclease IV [Dehalococcoidia bacterium]
MTKDEAMKIGAHVSTAGGPVTLFDRAEAIGAEAAQIFLTPPQQWRSSKVEPEQAEAFRARAKDSPVGPIFVHGIYLINLATADETMLTRSTSSLKSALRSCSDLGIAGVIFHLGSHKGQGLDAVFDQVCTACTNVLKETPEDALLVLENSAGAGGNIGSLFPDLGRIIRGVGNPRVKVCLDTQHSFAAGYDLSTAEGLELAMTEFEREVGVEQLVAVHANDSKVELGSGRDRHENIGDGHIGLDGFRRILGHRVFKDAPFLLEVPGLEGKGPDQANIDLLKKLRAEAGIEA